MSCKKRKSNQISITIRVSFVLKSKKMDSAKFSNLLFPRKLIPAKLSSREI